MKKFAATSMVAGILCFCFVTAYAFDVYFDTNRYCRQVADVVGGSYQIEQTCHEQELDAKRKLERMIIPERIKKYCTEVAQTIGGSYQIMKTCVEQELSAKRKLGY